MNSLTIKIIPFILFALSSCAMANKEPLPTVDFVDLNRYIGKWYEIARFEQSFQKGCTQVSAVYAKKDNGEISVTNSCVIKETGKFKQSSARAWVTDKKTNAKLKVQFFLRSIRLPFLAGNYWIIDLDEENYEYAMVGDPTRKYLWILARGTNLDSATFEMLKSRAQDLGFDTSKLLITEH